MKLSPLARAASPAYPPRAARGGTGLARWARRLGAAAAGALLLGAAGCYGATRYGPDPEVVEEGDGAPSPEPSEPLPAPPRLDPLPTPDDAPEPVPEPEECVPEFRLSGLMAPPNLFSCEADPEPSFTAPMDIGAGELCAEGPAWARFEVAEGSRYRITLQPSGEGILLAVLDPEGRELLALGPEPSCADLEMAPGTWTLRAEASSPGAPGYFELYVDAAPTEG